MEPHHQEPRSFPRLKRIYLYDLPMLQHICGGHSRMYAPKLKTVQIRGCWSLKRLLAVRRALRGSTPPFPLQAHPFSVLQEGSAQDLRAQVGLLVISLAPLPACHSATMCRTNSLYRRIAFIFSFTGSITLVIVISFLLFLQVANLVFLCLDVWRIMKGSLMSDI